MKEHILNNQRIFSGRLFNVEVCDVRLPDGNTQQREVVRHPGATALVALDGEGRVLLVRQFRIASGQVMSEIPAGTLNPEESPESCAIRELQEETGFKPGRIEAMGGFFVAPGYTTEYIHLFLATDLIESRLAGDADEFIQVDHIPLPEVLAMIERGDIADAKTIVGVLRYAARKQ